MGEKKGKLILLYSGGLDTSVIVHWLAAQGYDVVCVTIDVGQQENIEFEEKALGSGAVKFVVKNITEEFVRDGVFQCVKAEAKYEGRYLLGTSIARPYMIKAIVDVAKEEGTNIVSHGATGKGNDQCRFELAAYALLPGAEIVAPWRMQEFRDLIPGRKEAIDYAAKYNIPIEASAEKPWSTDPNAQHRSHEAGELEDPWYRPRDEMYQLVTPPTKAPDEIEKIEVEFEAGIAVAVNGERLQPVELLEKLNVIAGRNGVGVVDMVENRFVGMKSRGVYEAPGATILYEAHRDIEGLTMDREVMRIRDMLVPRYSELVYNGYWFHPAKKCLDAYIDESQKNVTGTVKCELYKGAVRAVGRKSPYSLYDADISTMEAGGSYNQDDATGFLRIVGLPVRVIANAKKPE